MDKFGNILVLYLEVKMLLVIICAINDKELEMHTFTAFSKIQEYCSKNKLIENFKRTNFMTFLTKQSKQNIIIFNY